MRRRTGHAVLVLVLVAGTVAALAWGYRTPADYGRIVLGNRAARAGLSAAQFDHWRHRARFTCRLCHVDVGFAMAVGETGITAESNRGGFHCGACHDGHTKFAGRPVFAACAEKPTDADKPRCARCHSPGDKERREADWAAFAEGKPKKGGGGDIDWEAAEAAGLVKPLDHVEGVSIPRPPLAMDKDVTIASRAWMSDVLFSHKKHAVWNGCEVCHPEIFPNTPGGTRMTMLEISSGQSCGVCHGKVAFSIGDCERCHTSQVR